MNRQTQNMITIIFYECFAMRIIHYTHTCINMDTQYDYHNLPPTLHDEDNYSIIHNVHMYMEQTYNKLYYNTFPLILHSKDNYTLYTHIYMYIWTNILYITIPFLLYFTARIIIHYTHMYMYIWTNI